MRTLSINGSSFINIINLFSPSYDQFWLSKKNKYNGISFGYFIGVGNFNRRTGIQGGYISYTYLSHAADTGHLEVQVGIGYAPSFRDEFGIRFLPVLSAGYRHQKPMENWFWRLSVGTMGIGMGFGFVF